MNLALKLTILRILLLGPFMIFMFIDNFFTRVLAFFIFILAAFTDILDGWIARKKKTVTEIGTLLDPIADKVVTSVAFIAFVGLRELGIPSWIVALIIIREFFVTGLRVIGISSGKVISASKSGKYKMTLQSLAIIFILFILVINSFFKKFFKLHPPSIFAYLPFWIMLLTCIFTLYSGILYFYKNKDLIK